MLLCYHKKFYMNKEKKKKLHKLYLLNTKRNKIRRIAWISYLFKSVTLENTVLNELDELKTFS